MEGKPPGAVITDGDMAMRNAIAHVFPDAHHRLCAWHLMRNAKANVCKPKFKKEFKKCMFDDYSVEEFEDKWSRMVVENDVGDIPWVEDTYAKKNMWASAYMRGTFFAGLRTTSRCEGLHTQIGKYVGSLDSLYEFVKHFDRCVNYIRNNEIEADLRSCEGDPVMQTNVPTLEMYASKIYTRDIFYLVREKLLELGSVKVVRCKTTASTLIHTVTKYTDSNVRSEWLVSLYVNDMEWRCSCKGMESFGIPCLHILTVIVYRDIHEIPTSLVCKRWSKNAKEGLERTDNMGNTSNASNRCIRFAALQHCCRRLCSVASRLLEVYNQARETVNGEIERIMSIVDSAGPSSSNVVVDEHENVRDPIRVSTKGCGSSSAAKGRKLKKPRRCS